MLEVVMPKNYVILLAGLVNLAFERLGTMPRQVIMPPKPDDLTMINGIGPTFARRLNEGGIDTFAKLAAAKPEDVKTIAKLADWQADPANWIAEAKQLA